MRCEGSEMLTLFKVVAEFGPGLAMVGGPVCRVCGADLSFENNVPGDLRAPEHEYVRYDGPPKVAYAHPAIEAAQAFIMPMPNVVGGTVHP